MDIIHISFQAFQAEPCLPTGQYCGVFLEDELRTAMTENDAFDAGESTTCQDGRVYDEQVRILPKRRRLTLTVLWEGDRYHSRRR